MIRIILLQDRVLFPWIKASIGAPEANPAPSDLLLQYCADLSPFGEFKKYSEENFIPGDY